jgi:large subunit ribosomal protein L15
VRPGFEGGQTPLHRRLPHRRGFTNTFQKKYAIINVGDIGDRFEPGTVVTPELLMERRIVRSLYDGLKVLGDGDLPHPLTVRAHKFSKAALEKLSACGGSAEVIEA